MSIEPHALDEPVDEDPMGSAKVLRVAGAQRPGICVELAAAFAAEAEHLRQLAQRTEAAIARLRRAGPALEPDATAAGEVSPTA